MTPEQESELAALKAALKQHIEEAEKATPGPWVIRDCNVYQKQGRHIFDFGPHHTPISEYPKSCLIQDEANAAFIAKARTMSPLACRIALAGIRALEEIASEDKAQGYVADLGADGDLLSILSIWKGDNPLHQNNQHPMNHDREPQHQQPMTTEQPAMETPRTDAATKTTDWFTGEPVVVADFARQLERDLNEARAEIEKMREAIKTANDSLHKCSRVIGAPKTYEWADEDVCDAAYNSAQASIAKLKPFIYHDT